MTEPRSTRSSQSAEGPGPASNRDPWLRGIALGAIALAVCQMLGWVKVETSTLYLLVIACVALVLPEIQKFSLGKDGIAFEGRFNALDKKVTEVTKGTEDLTTAIRNGVGGKAQAPQVASGTSAAAVAPTPPGPPKDPDDPQAGRWGEKDHVDDRRVTAKVTRSALQNGWFKVELLVESTNTNRPLSGTVTFHLHPTFRESTAVRRVVEGRATLELLAWGAFTVGVETDDGKTQLELNLAGVPGAPADFTAR